MVPFTYFNICHTAFRWRFIGFCIKRLITLTTFYRFLHKTTNHTHCICNIWSSQREIDKSSHQLFVYMVTSYRSLPSAEHYLESNSTGVDIGLQSTIPYFSRRSRAYLCSHRNIPSSVRFTSRRRQCFNFWSSFIWNHMERLALVCWISSSKSPVMIRSSTYTRTIVNFSSWANKLESAGVTDNHSIT